MQFRAHLHTVNRHRRLVRRYCLKLGLVWQGLTHDLSKYSPTEFWRGCKYYQGWRSPNDQERLENGVSLAWLHHKGRNRHHFEYWIDYRIARDGSRCHHYVFCCAYAGIIEVYLASVHVVPVANYVTPLFPYIRPQRRKAFQMKVYRPMAYLAAPRVGAHRLAKA